MFTIVSTIIWIIIYAKDDQHLEASLSTGNRFSDLKNCCNAYLYALPYPPFLGPFDNGETNDNFSNFGTGLTGPRGTERVV